jgi:hypothetical protein
MFLSTPERLLLCIEAIAGWMGSNRLKLNPDKTQIIWLGSRHQLAAVQVVPLRLHDGTIIAPSTSVRNLGVMLDCELSMAEHVNSIVRSCFYQLRQLRFVRHSLSEGTARMLVHAFVASRVDYCNSLLHGASQQTIRRLQAVLNASARLISGVGRYDHITAVLRDDLHWLPVTQRIEFKLALLVYKCLHGIGPDYLSPTAPPYLSTTSAITCALLRVETCECLGRSHGDWDHVASRRLVLLSGIACLLLLGTLL